MKKQVNVDFLEMLAMAEFATKYHYKIMLLLMTGAFTQAQIAEKLGMLRQNVNAHIKDLKKNGYIKVDRIEGRNMFLKANTTVSAVKKAAETESMGKQLTFIDNETKM